MASAAELRQELIVAELEEALIRAKAAQSVTMELKLELRAAREKLRNMRAGRPVEPDDANPGVITTEAI